MAVDTRRWHSERGAELIEFALVLPILLLLIAGVVDFGMMFQAYEVVTNAAREGARVGVLPNYQAVDVQTRVTAYCNAAGLTGCTVNPPAQNVTVTTTAGSFTAKSVRVSYTYTFAVLGMAAPLFGGNFGNIQLNAVSVMRAETQAAP